jgi:hypothetical protein
MTLTSLGSVSNSASETFVNAKAKISLINYGRIIGSIGTYQFNLDQYTQLGVSYGTKSNSGSPTHYDNFNYNPKKEQQKIN